MSYVSVRHLVCDVHSVQVWRERPFLSITFSVDKLLHCVNTEAISVNCKTAVLILNQQTCLRNHPVDPPATMKTSATVQRKASPVITNCNATLVTSSRPDPPVVLLPSRSTCAPTTARCKHPENAARRKQRRQTSRGGRHSRTQAPPRRAALRTSPQGR